MVLKSIQSNVLKLMRLATAVLALVFLNLALYSYDKATPIWLWGAAGVFALVCATLNYFIYRELKRRPLNNLYVSVKQSYYMFMLVSLITFCVIIFKMLTLQDITDRMILFGLMVLLLFSDVMTTCQVRKYESKI